MEVSYSFNESFEWKFQNWVESFKIGVKTFKFIVEFKLWSFESFEIGVALFYFDFKVLNFQYIVYLDFKFWVQISEKINSCTSNHIGSRDGLGGPWNFPSTMHI